MGIRVKLALPIAFVCGIAFAHVVSAQCVGQPDGTPCSIDTDPNDCVSPGCQAGVCVPNKIAAPNNSDCSTEAGVPVFQDPNDCVKPGCNGGICNPYQLALPDNATCTSQGGAAVFQDPNDCVTPGCNGGICNPYQLALPDNATCTSQGGAAVFQDPNDCVTPGCNGGICNPYQLALPDNATCSSQGGAAVFQDPNDCVTPGCNGGICNPYQLALPDNASCSSQAGVPVPPQMCLVPLCTSGVCQNTPDVQADVAVTKTGMPERVSTGVIVTYTLTVTNAGPFNSANTMVVDNLPANFIVLSAVPTQGTCMGVGTSTVSCNLGEVGAPAQCPPAPTTAMVIIKARVAVGHNGTVTDMAMVSTGDVLGDPDLNNNTASATTMVVTAAPSLSRAGMVVCALLLLGAGTGTLYRRRFRA